MNELSSILVKHGRRNDGRTCTKVPPHRIEKIIGYCLPTQKSGIAAGFFKSMGFERQTDGTLLSEVHKHKLKNSVITVED